MFLSNGQDNTCRRARASSRNWSVSNPTNCPNGQGHCYNTFPGDRYVNSVIAGQLSSGSWTGPFSGRLKYELEIAEGWEKDPDPLVGQFAKGLVKGLKERLKRQVVMEEEGRYI